MALLGRILESLYWIASRIIQNSLIKDPDQRYDVPLVVLTNFLIVIAIVGCFGIALYMLVWAVSLAIFLDALFIAYLSALLWEKLCRHFPIFDQEIYLIGSTVGHTVLLGTLFQLDKLQWADGKTLYVYWIFLLIVGFIIWRITVFNVTRIAGVNPVLAIKEIKYKQRFRLTKIAKKVSTENQAQAYLRKMK